MCSFDHDRFCRSRGRSSTFRNATFNHHKHLEKKSFASINVDSFYKFVNNKLSCKNGIDPFKKMMGPSQMMTMYFSTSNIFKMVTDRETLLLRSNRTSHIDFRFTYLLLTVTHSKGQGQTGAYFDGKYFGNSERYE